MTLQSLAKTKKIISSSGNIIIDNANKQHLRSNFYIINENIHDIKLFIFYMFYDFMNFNFKSQGSSDNEFYDFLVAVWWKLSNIMVTYKI